MYIFKRLDLMGI